MRIGMDAVQIIQNSYLEAQLMTDLVLSLTSPIWVGLPSVFSDLSSGSRVRVDIDRYQIFIKLTFGNSILVWVHGSETVETLIAELEQREGIPRTSFFFLHEGKIARRL